MRKVVEFLLITVYKGDSVTMTFLSGRDLLCVTNFEGEKEESINPGSSKFNWIPLFESVNFFF